MMHGATTIDHDGKVIRPCILWNDTRSYMSKRRSLMPIRYSGV
jgi:sugar (pentulose or hexulose) kinase